MESVNITIEAEEAGPDWPRQYAGVAGRVRRIHFYVSYFLFASCRPVLPGVLEFPQVEELSLYCHSHDSMAMMLATTRGEQMEARWAAEPNPAGWLNAEWLPKLKGLRNLRKLDLSGHGKCPNEWLTDAGLEGLIPMPPLRELVLAYCPKISPQALERFRRACPDCAVLT